MLEGYEVFRGIKMLIVHQLVPFILSVFFLYKNYRPDILSNSEHVLMKRTMIAASLFLVTNMSNLPSISYQVYDAFNKIQGHKEVVWPNWIWIFMQVSYFLAMLPPALYSFIFCGSDLILHFCKNVRAEEELLIEDEVVEEDGYNSTHV